MVKNIEKEVEIEKNKCGRRNNNNWAGPSFGKGKQHPCKAWPCSILNVVSGLYFAKEISQVFQSP